MTETSHTQPRPENSPFKLLLLALAAACVALLQAVLHKPLRR